MDHAIAWSVRLAAPDVSEEQLTAFAAWLEADPANPEAYERVSGFETSLDAAVEDFAAQTVQNEQKWPVAVPANISKFPPRFGGVSRRGWLAGGAALLAACAVLFVTLRPDGPASVTTYTTQTGQQKTVALSDGTIIKLNTATTIIVAPDGDTRHITLARGEALFHVAKDATHPFLVTAADRRVRVVGTVFSVRRQARDVTVVVAQGKVAVGPKTAAPNHNNVEKHLVPGDKLVYATNTGTTTVKHVDPAQALAWQHGYLIYKNAPLAQVVTDLNRYFPHPVSLDGATVRAQRFSGVLKIDREEIMLRRLQKLLPITAQKEPDGRIMLRARQKHD